MGSTELDKWVFRFVSQTNMWFAVKRENYRDMFNDITSPNVLKSSNIDTLTDVINRTGGDSQKINELLNYDRKRKETSGVEI